MTETFADAEPEGRRAFDDTLLSGRYLAENGRWFVQLRVDADEATISADLTSRDQDGPCELWVKTRSAAPEEVQSQHAAFRAGVAMPIDLLDGKSGTSAGTITLTPVPGQHGRQVRATFAVERAICGLVPGIDLRFRGALISSALRDVGLEIEQESGLDLDLDSATNGVGLGKIRKVLEDAKLYVHPVGQSSVVPQPANGSWSASDIFSELSRQVRRAAQAPLSSSAWELHLMLLSRTDRAGLLGIMFDFLDDLPRQGAAVFVGEIRDRYPDDVTRRVLTTVVHELGHCLNLAHRFNREINQVNSSSFMNYDWMFDGGDHAAEYWDQFAYTFDRDELEFLRHGPREQVIPGGAPFGSARYWTKVARPGPDPQATNQAAKQVKDLQLWLSPPALGTRFGYGAPVYLQVSLRNVGGQIHCLPRHVLDVKAGLLEILVRRRRPSSWTHTDDREPFSPFMRRCFAVEAPDRTALRPGESVHDNVSLTFGSAGSPFADPGEYAITPVLTIYDPSVEGSQVVIEGAELAITIDPPTSRAENRDAEMVRRNDVGASLALGGAECLERATGVLEEVVDRRSRDDLTNGRPDGLLAAAARTLGIQAGRRGQRGEALRRLEQVTKTTLRLTLDPHTAQNTSLLAQRQRPGNADRGTRVAVTVSRSSDGAVFAPHTVEGVLVSIPPRVPDGVSVPAESIGPVRTMRSGWPGEGIAVVLDAAPFAETLEVGASAVVTGADGLTERITVTQLRILEADAEGESPIALALLARPVPSADSMTLRCRDIWSARTVADVRRALRDVGMDLDPAPAFGLSGAAVADVADPGWPDGQSPVVEPVVPQLETVASWIRIYCLFSKRCDIPPPDSHPLPSDSRQILLPLLGCSSSRLDGSTG